MSPKVKFHQGTERPSSPHTPPRIARMRGALLFLFLSYYLRCMRKCMVRLFPFSFWQRILCSRSYGAQMHTLNLGQRSSILRCLVILRSHPPTSPFPAQPFFVLPLCTVSHAFACMCLLSCPGRLASQRDHPTAPTRTASLDGSPAQPRTLRRAPRRGHRRRVLPGWIAAATRRTIPRCECRYVVVQISLF
jgi:hypothetical protein